MISIDQFHPERDYQMVSDWWTTQKWPVIPLSHLSRLGFMVSANGTPACCGWLYQTDSAICWFEWIVANPEVRGEERKVALESLIEKAKEAAAAMGFVTVFMSAQNQSLISRLKKAGFTETDQSMTNLIFQTQGGF